MTTLITGATGVVGGAMLRHLSEQGDRPRALVRSEDGARPGVPMGRGPGEGGYH